MQIEYERDGLLADYAVGMLKEFYLKEGEESPQDGYARACIAWSTYHGKTDHKLAERLYEAVSKKWFMFASPVLSNAPANGEKMGKGLPISCFLSFVDDSVEGLIDHTSELRWLSVMGGGIGGHWGDVRPVGKKSPGTIPFIHTVDADIQAYKQGMTRKGSYAAYMDISHPDIVEFINIRVPTGDVQRKALNIHNAVNISDDFMVAVLKDDDFDLVNPNDGNVTETVKARKLFERLLEIRFRTGEPYLNFIDTANDHLPESLKKMGLKIHGSNLCLDENTKVTIKNSSGVVSVLTIKETVEMANNGESLAVLAKNIDENEVIFGKISEASLMNECAHVLEIYDDDSGRTLVCTPDHQVYTKNRGYVRAEDLVEDDILDILDAHNV